MKSLWSYMRHDPERCSKMRVVNWPISISPILRENRGDVEKYLLTFLYRSHVGKIAPFEKFYEYIKKEPEYKVVNVNSFYEGAPKLELCLATQK